MLNWAQRFNIFCFLDNHQYQLEGHRYEWLLAADAQSFIQAPDATIADLDAFLQEKEWVFGHLSYELKNSLFHLTTDMPDPIGFPLFYFFQPRIVLSLQGNCLEIEATDPQAVYDAIAATPAAVDQLMKVGLIQQQLSQADYLEKVKALQQHIQRGDCYEINFCQAFFAEEANINPVQVYQDLVQLSPTPFSAFYRVEESYLLCASPERFLQKRGQQVIAQPMKGTAKRSPEKDEQVIADLLASQKERSENVMIVDLMRNDLSRICEDGSVRVSELFGIYTFPQVHQMVSTVEGRLREDIRFSNILQATFPMGSMTGAPKKRVLELIDQYEPTARGIFSGSVGYFHNGDFDFNVVIRSIMYNEATNYLSYQVGSGITIYADPECEWEECLLKAAAIKKVLT